MKLEPTSTIFNNITNDKELVDNFMDYMKLITKQTGVEFIIDTNRE